jgi:hypothetical protein
MHVQGPNANAPPPHITHLAELKWRRAASSQPLTHRSRKHTAAVAIMLRSKLAEGQREQSR